MTAFEPILDHRARLERQRLEAEERRERAVRDQTAPQNSAAARISAWEQLHHLRLPSDPSHEVLRHVAKQTELSLADVQGVQRQRAAARVT